MPDTRLVGADWPVGKVAIVTGAASGIGLGIAQRLARDGATLAILDLNGDVAGRETAKVCAEGVRKISPPRAHFWCLTRRATSPGRLSASMAAGIPK